MCGGCGNEWSVCVVVLDCGGMWGFGLKDSLKWKVGWCGQGDNGGFGLYGGLKWEGCVVWKGRLGDGLD